MYLSASFLNTFLDTMWFQRPIKGSLFSVLLLNLITRNATQIVLYLLTNLHWDWKGFGNEITRLDIIFLQVMMNRVISFMNQNQWLPILESFHGGKRNPHFVKMMRGSVKSWMAHSHYCQEILREVSRSIMLHTVCFPSPSVPLHFSLYLPEIWLISKAKTTMSRKVQTRSASIIVVRKYDSCNIV